MAVKLAVYFSDENIGKYKFRCVCCGEELEEHQAMEVWEIGFPPSCEKHMRQVEQEMDADTGMWPLEWYGHSWQTDQGDWRSELS